MSKNSLLNCSITENDIVYRNDRFFVAYIDCDEIERRYFAFAFAKTQDTNKINLLCLPNETNGYSIVCLGSVIKCKEKYHILSEENAANLLRMTWTPLFPCKYFKEDSISFCKDHPNCPGAFMRKRSLQKTKQDPKWRCSLSSSFFNSLTSKGEYFKNIYY